MVSCHPGLSAQEDVVPILALRAGSVPASVALGLCTCCHRLMSKSATLAVVRLSRDAITCACFVTSWVIPCRMNCLQEPGLGILWPKWWEVAVHGCCGCVVHSRLSSLVHKPVYYESIASLATLYQSWVYVNSHTSCLLCYTVGSATIL